jgi:hypothetical protein
MLRRTWIARLFTTAVAAAAISGVATAGIIPASVTVTPEAGNFRWTYSVVLPTDMKLQAGDYFTIYDFGGLVPGSAFADPPDHSTGLWDISTSNSGPIPAGLKPTDNPDVPNLVFRYLGPTIATGQVGLGNFGAVSTVGQDQGVRTDFTAQNPQASTGQTDRNIVDTTAPGVPSGGGTNPTTPEPATLVMAGLGLPLVGAARLLRRRKQG